MITLRDRLLAAMDPRQIFHAPVWGNPRVMTEALRDIKRTFGGNEDDSPTNDVLQESLRRFALTQEVANFTELKYICYGVAAPVGGQRWRLIDHGPLFTKLLSLVEARSRQARQYRRCYQGLLNSYFGFDRGTVVDAGSANWNQLRDFLSEKLRPLFKTTADRGTMPEWLHALAANRNLLTDDPCSRYAAGLSVGRTDELKTVCSSFCGAEGFKIGAVFAELDAGSAAALREFSGPEG